MCWPRLGVGSDHKLRHDFEHRLAFRSLSVTFRFDRLDRFDFTTDCGTVGPQRVGVVEVLPSQLNTDPRTLRGAEGEHGRELRLGAGFCGCLRSRLLHGPACDQTQPAGNDPVTLHVSAPAVSTPRSQFKVCRQWVVGSSGISAASSIVDKI